jgi:hypothetical protein
MMRSSNIFLTSKHHVCQTLHFNVETTSQCGLMNTSVVTIQQSTKDFLRPAIKANSGIGIVPQSIVRIIMHLLSFYHRASHNDP